MKCDDRKKNEETRRKQEETDDETDKRRQRKKIKSKQKVLLKHISDIVIDEPYLTDENKQHVLI